MTNDTPVTPEMLADRLLRCEECLPLRANRPEYPSKDAALYLAALKARHQSGDEE